MHDPPGFYLASLVWCFCGLNLIIDGVLPQSDSQEAADQGAGPGAPRHGPYQPDFLHTKLGFVP